LRASFFFEKKEVASCVFLGVKCTVKKEKKKKKLKTNGFRAVSFAFKKG